MHTPRYNPPQLMNFISRLLVAAAAVAIVLPAARAATWEQPAAALAGQIASLAGPGTVQLIVDNRSSLSGNEVVQIRRLLERDLRGLGVLPGGSNSATLVRVTLSQNLHGGLWVAQVEEGTEIRVTMLPVQLDSAAPPSRGGPGVTLQRTVLITEQDPVLDAQIFAAGGEQRLVVLEPSRVLVYARSTSSLAAGAADSGWVETHSLAIAYDRPAPRDLRGRVAAGQDDLFDAWLPGMLCRGTNDGPAIALSCANSDDPWPVTTSQGAFYDSARNYFTGVLAPGFGMELPPFYEAAEIPRPGGPAVLLENVDGNAIQVENQQIESVDGTGDWGSDLAAVRSACGPGDVVVVSGSGAAAAADSLRAYSISGREALPVSEPLPVPGTVMAIWPTASGDRAMAMVRRQNSGEYEVWSVAASCD